MGFYDRLDVGEFEDAQTVVETYRVYDIGNEEWVDVGVKDEIVTYFVDPETEEPIDVSQYDDDVLKNTHASIDLFQRGNDGGRGRKKGNRFLATKSDKYGNFLTIKSYQDGEIKTLLQPEYDRQQWGNGFDLSLEKIQPHRKDLYIINENGGKAVIHDNGVEMERVDANHYDEIEHLDDGALIGVKDGKRNHIVIEE